MLESSTCAPLTWSKAARSYYLRRFHGYGFVTARVRRSNSTRWSVTLTYCAPESTPMLAVVVSIAYDVRGTLRDANARAEASACWLIDHALGVDGVGEE